MLKNSQSQNLSEINPNNHSKEDVFNAWVTGKSPHTQKAYRTSFNQFVDFMTGKYPGIALERFDLNHLQGFQRSLDGKSDNTIRLRLSAIKSLLTFCQTAGICSGNVGLNLKVPKATASLTERYLEPEEVTAIIEKAKDGNDKIILQLLYYTGIRTNEALTLKQSRVKKRGKAYEITVVGKGKKKRTLKINKKLYKKLNRIYNPESKYVFTTSSGNQLKRTQVRRYLKMACKKAKVKKRVTMHWLRHSAAVHSLRNRLAIHTLKNNLGHSSLATTSIYLDHVSNEKGIIDFIKK